MDKKEKKSLPEPRTYTVEQIAAMLNISPYSITLVTLYNSHFARGMLLYAC